MSESRARRRTAKRVDYAKEQEFSDVDVFEDSEDEPAPTKRRGRKPKAGTGIRTAVVSSSAQTGDDEDEVYDDRPIYTEKGYDPSLPPIRERFPFLPEYEEDGSPKIELIVGRRPVDEKDGARENKTDEAGDDTVEDDRGSRRRGGSKSKSATGASKSTKSDTSGHVEYEYLVKYKGKSYLHLEWKSGADLESMNKSAKGIYRRYLKKVYAGTEEDIENPEFDPSYVVPERVLDEADQEISVDLTDKELLKWEKQREKEMAEESDDEKDSRQDDNKTPQENEEVEKESSATADEKENGDPVVMPEDWTDDEIDFKKLTIDKLRKILEKEDPYYPRVKGSDNPYRDGYATEPPKKPRASYLFFQCTLRPFYQKKYPSAIQAELMSMLAEKWRSMSDEQKEPFLQVAQDEAKQFEKEKTLLAKAQRPNEVWQPLRRCLMVLDRLARDSFADIFLEPVDLEDFPDYEEVVDSPMDLGTVRKKIKSKKYQAPEQYARDMRKVWNNCKIYNQHGSAIWHVADYMSKLFERLYQAWVLDFRERYLRWADPRARPWEHTCRQTDGKCNTPDDQMVLCDHCDAMYGFKCVKPPLKKLPTKAWHCPECKPKLKTAKGMRMLSAVAEHAARKRAELGDLPKKKVQQAMFLVKWKNLGYEFCTWETRVDVNDDRLIAAFRRLNSGNADETELEAEPVKKLLKDTKHISESSAGVVGGSAILRSQLYAQTRSLEFLRFGNEHPPHRLCIECGPQSRSTCTSVSKSLNVHPRDVVSCLGDLTFRVALNDTAPRTRKNSFLPALMTGEYDAIIPITSKGLMMNVGEINGSVAFLGYRSFPDGSKGPAELSNLIRSVGDKIIAVDGQSTVGKSFKDVIGMLRESGKNKFAYMRFLESRFSVCDGSLVSSGDSGRYAIEELHHKFVVDRQLVLLQRQNVAKDDTDNAEKDVHKAEKRESDEESEDEGSEGEFQPESDEEEGGENGDPSEVVDIKKSKSVDADATIPTPKVEKPSVEVKREATAKPATKGVIQLEESTQSLAFRLLDIDVGYSSDEGGDEDQAYFLDGVDSTFTSLGDIEDLATDTGKKKDKFAATETATLPARQNDFTTLGERAKLVAAVLLSKQQPDDSAFLNYPFSQEMGSEPTNKLDVESPTRAAKRSTVKIEQINATSGEVIHIWSNVESAAATMQLPLPALRQVLRGDYDEEIGDEVGGYKWRYALAGAKATAGLGSSSRSGGGKKAKEAWLEFRDKLYDPNEPHIYKNGNRLRDYQVDGVNWLSSIWYKRQGCILADEMGLGKTVQIVTFIEHLFRVEKIRRPYLVVVPLSTVEHWRREFEGWTDMICCVYHDRQRVWRDVLREYEWYFEDRPHTQEYLKFDVLVTTYDTLIGDFDVISQIPFRVAVVDEAHRLRNQKGKLLECMREISAKGTMQYGYQSRVLMSGTPLQNDLTELWTLLNFIEPYKFPELSEFQTSFGNMANQDQVQKLQQMISPFMLRRVKEDVAKDIPAKEETVIDVELTSLQKQYYRAIFEHNHAFLTMGVTRQTTPKLMNIQMELRKVCNHPFLLDGVEHRELDKFYKELSDSGKLRGKSTEEQQFLINEQGYVMSSGKMVLLDKLLPKLRQEGHKVLIFSQMVKMLDLISEYCEFRDFRYERLDGRVRGSERQKAIDRFEREPDSFIFLLSTRAGGVGINLTAADTCIIFDSDWNPQNDIQAQARCHRIGQTRDVMIYRLVTSRSFEQEMFDRASKKLGLEQAVLGTFEKEKDDDRPTQQEMEQLLKRGAYALLEDENDEMTKEFCADDIESILAKRTRTRVVEGAKTASWLNKQGMMISKSKFSAESGGDALDMDDPEFWQKVMPDFVTPSLMMQKLNDLQHEVEGTVKGPGRGRRKRGRPPKGREKESETELKQPNETLDSETKSGDQLPVDNDDNEESEDEDKPSDIPGNKLSISRANARKVQNFIGELKGMMEGLFVEEDEDGMNMEEKDVCQKLLLTISVKEKIFNEEQRQMAKKFLKKLEGNRRRRCRTSEQRRFTPGRSEDDVTASIPQELRIESMKTKKRRKRSLQVEESTPDRRRKRRHDENGGGFIGEDGYLHHSDSGEDWSDVGEEAFPGGAKKDWISTKEARRRRSWLAGLDDAAAAGRPWPVFPRHVVNKVLMTLLDDMIEYDENRGGTFSEPVSKEDFPDYYEQIAKPMDYGTMKTKFDHGEYRTAQAMQRDFILILQNCKEFNDKKSDIVKEAFEQHLMRPKLLKDSAAKHGLFIAEDGTILEIRDEEKLKSPKKRRKRSMDGPTLESKSKKPKPTKNNSEKGSDSDVEDGDEEAEVKKVIAPKSGKPRIRISLDKSDAAAAVNKKVKKIVKRKRASQSSDDVNAANEDEEATTAKQVKKRQRKSSAGKGKNGSASTTLTGAMYDALQLKKKREALDGSFESSRKHLTKHGPWKLPPDLSDKFREVALSTLAKMDKHDRYSVFADAVSEEEAPGYSEVVDKPMDFGTMRKKVGEDRYGTGSEAAAALFTDFLLVFDNCSLYNPDDSEVAEEAARVLGLLPETFAASCCAVVAQNQTA